jgi:hypothetical protein
MSQINYPQRRKHVENQGIQKRDVNAAQRAVQAVRMRAEGKGYQEIAAMCSYGSAGAAHKAVMRELQRVVVTNVEELRATELHRLELMHAECWKLFMDPKNKGRLFAVDRILAISERKAKLMGLDIPVDQAINQNVVVVREVPGYLGIVEQGK